MPTFKRGNATIYYEDSGVGEPVIANHGLAENANYWSVTNVAQALAKNYRFVSMDMRDHGHSHFSNFRVRIFCFSCHFSTE